MAIRLSKAIKELNIGLQTAVEFLTKKYDLGDAKIDQTLSEIQKILGINL